MGESEGRFTGRVAVVTGGGSGIGEAIARRLASEGATVVVNDWDGDAAVAVAADLPGEPAAGEHLPRAGDVSDREQVRAMYDAIDDRFGRLDVVVNNAGIAEGEPGELDRINEAAGAVVADAMSPAVMAGGPRQVHWDELRKITPTSWDRMLAIHLTGTFHNVQAAVTSMIATGGGSIVNISSGAAVMGVPGNPHYAAAKAGVLGLTRAAAAELGSRGIRVNAIMPGLIDTPSALAGASDALRQMLAGSSPLRRTGRPEEIAAVAAFLASDDASYLTGQALGVDGGIHM